MGRRKQRKPNRSGGIVSNSNNIADQSESETKHESLESEEVQNDELDEIDQPYYVKISGSDWGSDEHFDVSEVLLVDLSWGEGFSGHGIWDVFTKESEKFALRFRLLNVTKSVDRMKLGHWPVLSSEDVFLEFVEKRTEESGDETCSVIFSGRFDGPDEGISGLAHLASLKCMALRPVIEDEVSNDVSSVRVRVEILRNAFDACESLLEITRQTWKKSMINVMAWLRPEVVTSEARYGVSSSVETDYVLNTELAVTDSNSKKSKRFKVSGFYEAIKPSKTDAMLEENLPDLLPELRPYQRRATHWMVQREKEGELSKPVSEEDQFVAPWCLPVEFLSTTLKMFYNPFSGTVSLEPDHSPERIYGGILADEMGLGKTVELLACVFAHPKEANDKIPGHEPQDSRVHKRLKKERVECVCGAVRENRRYKGLWVQCDMCDAWQHADCVGYTSNGKILESKENSEDTKGGKRKNDTTTIVERDGTYICQPCSEPEQATDAPVPSGATLIVCPSPILSQWHSEITRHTRPGSLKTLIYDGVRDASLANRTVIDIEELVNADIVLTTYDVLKEDLSHDSDRHEGDRRFLRFQKRYPVIPTQLTKISWWRVCLDEAQMVESSATAASEMARRLDARYRWCITGTPIQRKLDDLFGLLRFLKASPFDVSRWWVEIMRDPYEMKDVGAMEFTHKYFKQIMWRSSKEHVADELQLPPQEECTSWLSLSPVEDHFYQRQHESCASYACVVMTRLRNKILNREASGAVGFDPLSENILTDSEAEYFLNTLLKLRQACCHPQVGSSGLRALHHAPMTMDEILMVLISKTKIEGEESLRRLVLASNGLAGIAMIEGRFNKAALLYKESLDIAKEHSADFRLDPLLNIHILHNLSELRPCKDNFLDSNIERCSSENPEKNVNKRENGGMFGRVFKRRKGAGNSQDNTNEINENSSSVNLKCDSSSSHAIDDDTLRVSCNGLKQKYLSSFSSRLYAAQEEFRKSYTQVCSAIRERKNQDTAWWMDGLLFAEQNKDFSSELIRKIEESISGAFNKSSSSQIPIGFRSLSGLKYHIKSGLDQLEACREVLLDQLLAIDQSMEKPKEEDILRVRYCHICQVNADGPLCVMCELDELFKNYEARLFRLNTAQGGILTSAEEAVSLQKKNSALNRYYWDLAQSNKTSNSSGYGHEESRKRDVRDKVVVSKSPSELEIVLGVIKNHCKAHLGRDGLSAATKHLHILEGMRKEYANSRTLAIAQTQVLQAHDEIKMATTRLQLRVQHNDDSLNSLSMHELPLARLRCASDKSAALNILSSIKGKLRYLKGLAQAKQKLPIEHSDDSSLTEDLEQNNEVDEELCPICHDPLGTKKMVFQCGHFVCCSCLITMTEFKAREDREVQHKRLRCPTCRQHTDFGNIAYVNDKHIEFCTSSPSNIDGPESWGASIVVQGSYGTKLEAVTRRILWIKAKDPKEKVLVFSSWKDVLDVLEHAFTANNISFTRMKGGRKSHVAISEFKAQNRITKDGKHKKDAPTQPEEEEQSVQVLMLLIQHGANGLNLLEAQHVVLVEPLLNPAAESQAISRVHRLGQQNRTLVHRFIVKNTVEESIYKLMRSRKATEFISGNTKNQDQAFLSLRDMEALFATEPKTEEADTDEKADESITQLSPSLAAAMAAEKRLDSHVATSST